MRRALYLGLAALAAFGCERRDRDRAREETRELGGEVQEGARDIGGEMKEGAKDIGGEMKEGADKFGDRLRDGTGRALTADERSQLESAAQRGGYQISFEDGKITAVKGGGRQPVAGQEASDDELETALKAKLQAQPGAENLQVDASGGVVTLKGNFDSVDSRVNAIQLCLDHPGVQQVILEGSSF